MPQRVDSSPILEDWALLVPAGRRMLAMPDSEVVVLTGTLFGDRRFPDGTCVVTSCVVELDPAGGIARTGSTRYRLGSPSCVFRRWMEEHGHLLADFVRRVPAIETRGPLHGTRTIRTRADHWRPRDPELSAD
ncbi:MAG TPA: hypothetical protein VKH82_04020 [Candidatus Binatia bacterium]|nr:hypothetical protein [Candidatus Binatia bacterium]